MLLPLTEIHRKSFIYTLHYKQFQSILQQVEYGLNYITLFILKQIFKSSTTDSGFISQTILHTEMCTSNIIYCIELQYNLDFSIIKHENSHSQFTYKVKSSSFHCCLPVM